MRNNVEKNMELKLLNHVVCANYNKLQLTHDNIDRIIENTDETWQPDRSHEERGSNTMQGKIAEEIVEEFINRYFSKTLSIKSYDEIRNDQFQKHAPFDFLIWKTGAVDIRPIISSIQRDIAQSPSRFVQLSGDTRALCEAAGVKIVEVKSTKIRQNLKYNAHFTGDYDDAGQVQNLINQIKKTDDIFCYPHYKRSESREPYTLSEYCQYVKSLEPELADYTWNRLKHKVIELEAAKQVIDIFIRVYLDEVNQRGFVIGFIKKEDLLDDAVVFKRMSKPNKSEKALYFAKKLEKTQGIDCLEQVLTYPSIVL